MRSVAFVDPASGAARIRLLAEKRIAVMNRAIRIGAARRGCSRTRRLRVSNTEPRFESPLANTKRRTWKLGFPTVTILFVLSTMGQAVQTTTPGRDVSPGSLRPAIADARVLLVEPHRCPAASLIVASLVQEARRSMDAESWPTLFGLAEALEHSPQPGEIDQFIHSLTGIHMPLSVPGAPYDDSSAGVRILSLPLSWQHRWDLRPVFGVDNSDQIGYFWAETSNAAIPTVPVSGTIVLGALGTTMISWLHRRKML